MNNTLDWDALKAFVEERKPVEVSAGLLEDWFWTGATVYADGKFLDDDRAYVTSYWATPAFKATMANGDVLEVIASKPETPQEATALKERTDKALQDLREFTAKNKKAREDNPV